MNVTSIKKISIEKANLFKKILLIFIMCDKLFIYIHAYSSYITLFEILKILIFRAIRSSPVYHNSVIIALVKKS